MVVGWAVVASRSLRVGERTLANCPGGALSGVAVALHSITADDSWRITPCEAPLCCGRNVRTSASLRSGPVASGWRGIYVLWVGGGLTGWWGLWYGVGNAPRVLSLRGSELAGIYVPVARGLRGPELAGILRLWVGWRFDRVVGVVVWCG